MCVLVCGLRVVSCGVKKGHQISCQLGYSGFCAIQHGCWQPNSGPLYEQYALFTTELFLQPWLLILIVDCYSSNAKNIFVYIFIDKIQCKIFISLNDVFFFFYFSSQSVYGNINLFIFPLSKTLVSVKLKILRTPDISELTYFCKCGKGNILNTTLSLSLSPSLSLSLSVCVCNFTCV